MSEQLALPHTVDLSTEIGETTEVSWTPAENLTYEEWEKIGRTFQQIRVSIPWWMGDYLNFGERKYGEMYTQAIEDTGKSEETLTKWKAVAARLPKELRRKELSHTHHFYVIYNNEALRGPLLDMAHNMALSSRELKTITKLEDNLIEDLVVAMEEGIEREGFLHLVEAFAKGYVEPREPKEDEEDGDDKDEDESPEPEEEEEASNHKGLKCEELYDFWEHQGVSLSFCGATEAMWDNNMAVRAEINEKGRAVLIWERMQ